MTEEKDDDALDIELTEEELEAIAKNKSKTVPNLPRSKKTPFTIENAPMAKSIMPNLRRVELASKLVVPPAQETDEDSEE